MKATPEHDERVANLKFGSVYPHYVSKVERKGRTEKELLGVLQWLTGYDDYPFKLLILNYIEICSKV
jgi:hypothetical protein